MVLLQHAQGGNSVGLGCARTMMMRDAGTSTTHERLNALSARIFNNPVMFSAFVTSTAPSATSMVKPLVAIEEKSEPIQAGGFIPKAMGVLVYSGKRPAAFG